MVNLCSGGSRGERLDCLAFCGSAALHAGLIKLGKKRGYAMAEHANAQKKSRAPQQRGVNEISVPGPNPMRTDRNSSHMESDIRRSLDKW